MTAYIIKTNRPMDPVVGDKWIGWIIYIYIHYDDNPVLWVELYSGWLVGWVECWLLLTNVLRKIYVHQYFSMVIVWSTFLLYPAGITWICRYTQLLRYPLLIMCMRVYKLYVGIVHIRFRSSTNNACSWIMFVWNWLSSGLLSSIFLVAH